MKHYAHAVEFGMRRAVTEEPGEDRRGASYCSGGGGAEHSAMIQQRRNGELTQPHAELAAEQLIQLSRSPHSEHKRFAPSCRETLQATAPHLATPPP
jgi:hypothetical protein